MHLQDLQLALESPYKLQQDCPSKRPFQGTTLVELATWLRSHVGTLSDAFRSLDLNGNGQVCRSDFEAGLQHFGGKKRLTEKDLEDPQRGSYQHLWRQLDSETVGYVTRPRFLHTLLLAEFVSFGI